MHCFCWPAPGCKAFVAAMICRITQLWCEQWVAASQGMQGYTWFAFARGVCQRIAPTRPRYPAHPGWLRCRATGREFKGKNIEKGIAFPTCLSVNRWGAVLQQACTKQHCNAFLTTRPAHVSKCSVSRAELRSCLSFCL